jgi:hypothetical protein
MKQLVKFFIYSAGGILLAAALIRLAIAADGASVLTLPEPMLGIPIRYAVLMAGAFELMVALICLFGRKMETQIYWLAWLAANFIVYRVGLFCMHCHLQATCLGSLTDPLQLSRGVTGQLFSLIPLYLLVGSSVGIISLWLQDIRVGKPALLKMSCPGCGVHIKFGEQNLGQKISCPQCRVIITLRKHDFLKMACFFCEEHIEFPAHAIGEKTPCPHCKMDITLKEPA